MKKLLCILLMLMLLITACALPGNNEAAGVDIEVKSLLEAKLQSVKSADVEMLMAILDPGDKELQREQANWLKDIKINPIESYSLELMGVDKVKDTEYKAKLRQRYSEDGKEYKLDYYNKYKRIDGKLYDAGNYFEELKQGNITIKYTSANKKLAEDVMQDMNQLYLDHTKRWGITPSRPMVIKMFDDIEELRQSIKFSMWQCGGWYEYGESVKLYMKKPFASKETMKYVVNHEMVHLFTVEKAAGNLAYWLSEGIASYYELPQNQKSPSQLMREMDVNLMTVDELESVELEKLEDQKQISDYYSNAHLITAFIIENYGAEKINEVLNELSKMPSFTGTTSENDMHYRRYLSQVLPKVLGLKDYETFKQLWENEKNKL